MKKILALLIPALLLISCGDETQSESKMDTLIPRKILFGNPEKASVSLSSDGKNISYLAPKDGVMNVYIAPLANLKAARAVTDDKRGIDSYFWAFDNKHIIYAQDVEGNENFRLLSTNIETNETIPLTPSNARSVVYEVSPNFPGEIIVGTNARKKEYFDAYKVDIITGKSELFYENNEYFALIVDDNFKLRFGKKKLTDGSDQVYQFDNAGNATLFDTITRDETLTTSIIDFNKSNDVIYMIDSRDRNTAALFSLNLITKEKQLLIQDDKADIRGVVVHPTERTVQAAVAEYTRRKWQFLDEAYKTEIEYLQTVHSGDVIVTSRSLDDNHWIVAYSNDVKPVAYYHFDRSKKHTEFLFFNQQELANYKLQPMEPVVIKSRDNLELVSYLTKPQNSPSPLVIMVHGGPNLRDVWGFSGRHQWLANRGYAVLSVNYRGSVGFGKDFINSGNGEWGNKMHNDLVDAVNWAIDNKITTKDQVAIMGGSYGGYATLVGLTFTPDLFVCGVDICGISNLATFLDSIPPYWKPLKAGLVKNLGADTETEAGRNHLKSRSPLTFADRIKKPLLIGQGQNDPRVTKAESDQIVEKMKQHNIPVTYVLYPDEGHGFVRPENSMSFFAIAERFLAKNLGGKVEPAGNDYKGSSFQFVHGEEYLDMKAANK